jgi:hypothetical protein
MSIPPNSFTGEIDPGFRTGIPTAPANALNSAKQAGIPDARIGSANEWTSMIARRYPNCFAS